MATIRTIWTIAAFVTAASASIGASAAEAESITLANDPALSPDGAALVFSWSGDLWTAPTVGGVAKPLTRHPGKDRDPHFSPDGKTLAFISDRSGSDQIWLMPADGSAAPQRITDHTAGFALEGWFADGQSLLAGGPRDHHWRGADRFLRVRLDRKAAEEVLFDSEGANGALSPDNKRLLFTREGEAWWRKGYQGSQASQIWLYDRDAKSFEKVLDPPTGARWPLWAPDGERFYYVASHRGAMNLHVHQLPSKQSRPLTEFETDSIVFPALSRDGSTIVFRHLFDLYRYHPDKADPPVKIELKASGDVTRDPLERRVLASASDAAFSQDGLEIAFTAGGDVWVMDTELRVPQQVTSTPEEERDPIFSHDENAILFVSDQGGQTDLWRAERSDPSRFWWLNSQFKLDRLTHDADVESRAKPSPDGSKIGFLKRLGDFWVIDADGKNAKRVIESWSEMDYDWSPDGRWIAYSRFDDDFNQDIWIAPIDGSRPPFNLSKHPDNESNPVWSPDGKLIAFTGRRIDTEFDIHFVWLPKEEDDKSSRERSLEKALEKMKGRSKKDRDKNKDDKDKPAEGTKAKEPVKVEIDFDDIHERLKRVSIPNSSERNLCWSPDSKKLAFEATIDGKPGVYTIEIPEDLKPKLFSSNFGSAAQPRWLESGNQLVGLFRGVPTSMAAGGKETSHRVRARQTISRPEKYRAAFDLCWRTMRDRYYDEKLGNRNWDEVRRRYADAAASAPDSDAFTTVVQLMLGELNGSHLGFRPNSDSDDPPAGPGPSPNPNPNPNPSPDPMSPSERGGSWRPQTAHLGVRFDPSHPGPGLKVRDVLPNGPADRKTGRIQPGETILAIDGATVDPSMDLTPLLNGPADRDVRLKVRGLDGQERETSLRPVSFAQARALLYDKWIKDNRKAADALSGGKLGYLHIRGMNMPSFHKFEEELYSAGAGKDGLIIDVRDNGGGSTADLLLTSLTQPHHAIARPRGGGPGYPQDRRVFATWTKPIVVLCNQNSFSNAEIFSHAVKSLKRGKLVGVPTAGGVISTGGTTIMDLGFLRLPTRGWHIAATGEDMELNGAVPDVIVWPAPADFAQGRDPQLKAAVETLLADVNAEKAKGQPRLRKASERAAESAKP